MKETKRNKRGRLQEFVENTGTLQMGEVNQEKENVERRQQKSQKWVRSGTLVRYLSLTC